MTDKPPTFDTSNIYLNFGKSTTSPIDKRSSDHEPNTIKKSFTEGQSGLEPLYPNGPSHEVDASWFFQNGASDVSQNKLNSDISLLNPAAIQSPTRRSTGKKSVVNGTPGDITINNSEQTHESPLSLNRPSRKASLDSYSYPLNGQRCRRTLAPDVLEFVEPGQHNNGLVGLANFGNTCYMNSALQCLLHNPLIKEFFLSGAYQSEINNQNIFGTKGVLLEHLADFFRVFFTVKAKEISPFRLKKEIDLFNQNFEAFKQHDAQEFFNYLLDVIHEDSNRVITRPYLQNVEGKPGEDDLHVARNSWIQFLRLNDSIISRFFIGQFKNHMQCPSSSCRHEVTTFDPFTILSLSIPAVSRKDIPLKYILEDNKRVEVTRLSLKSLHSFGDITCQDVINAFAGVKGVSTERLWCCIFSKNNYNDRFDPHQYLEDILPKLKRNDCLGIMQVSDFSQKASQKSDCIWVNIDITWGNNNNYVVDEFDDVYSNIPVITRLLCFDADAVVKDLMLRIVELLLPHSSLMASEEEYPQDLSYYEGHLNLMNENRKDRRFFDVISDDTKLTRNEYSRPLGELRSETDHDVFLRIDVYPKPRTQVTFNFDYFADVDAHNHTDCEVVHVSQPAEWSLPDEMTLPILLSSFSHTEVLDSSNKWMCPGCRQEVQAEKTISIYKAPRYLTIHFKKIKTRYSQVQNVSFNLDLDMSAHVLNSSSVADYQVKPEEYMPLNLIELLNDQNRSAEPEWHNDKHTTPQYRLYAVVYHYGRQNYGHYTVACRVGSQWYEFNDETITEIQEDQVCTDDAYLLLYERV